MTVYRLIPVVLALLAGCSSFRTLNPALPSAVVGTTTASKYSGWARNWCSKGEPVKNLHSSPALNCLMVGGEIHVVRVKNGKSLIDGSPIPAFDILIPAAVDSVGAHGIVLVVEAAPSDMAADTGVHYWAKEFSFQYSRCPEDKEHFPSAACFEELKKRYVPEH